MFKDFNCLPYMDLDDGLVINSTSESEVMEDGGVEEQEVAETVVNQGVEEQEVAAPTKTDSDARFAQMRRENEDLQRRIQEAESRAQQYDDTLGLFFQGDNKIAQAKALFNDVPVEKMEADMELEEKARKYEELSKQMEEEKSRLEFENIKMRDIEAIKKAGFEVDMNFVSKNEDYMRSRAIGFDAVKAYQIANEFKPQPPKSMGTVQVQAPQNDFYTREQVQNMSHEDRLKNIEVIKASQKRWIQQG